MKRQYVNLDHYNGRMQIRVMVNEMAFKKFEFTRHVLDDLTEGH